MLDAFGSFLGKFSYLSFCCCCNISFPLRYLFACSFERVTIFSLSVLTPTCLAVVWSPTADPRFLEFRTRSCISNMSLSSHVGNADPVQSSCDLPQFSAVKLYLFSSMPAPHTSCRLFQAPFQKEEVLPQFPVHLDSPVMLKVFPLPPEMEQHHCYLWSGAHQVWGHCLISIPAQVHVDVHSS